MKITRNLMMGLFAIAVITSCISSDQTKEQTESRIPVIFDTDANNELDDQHAMAYLLLDESTFNVIGITVNKTWGGGEVEAHYKEAERVLNLCDLKGKIPIFKGANGGFTEIMDHTGEPDFDGSDAVNFIIEEARKRRSDPLVLLAVGKLTNVALALKKEPAIAKQIRVVWLGSNYPEPGEYNQDNDTASMNYVLKTSVPFEMATVRYGTSSGTAEVKVSRREIYTRMPGLGPKVEKPVTGRHGDSFTCFGDYSVNLFQHIEHLEDGCYRALFDMAAVAIVKDPSWAAAVEIPSPVLIHNAWVEQPDNKRKIIVWEDFHKEEILADFYSIMEKQVSPPDE
ncbi:MAG: nucleoside hydrolase [Bacteroidota bacterium]